MKTNLLAILLACSLSVVSTGWCDIYRHEDSDETISFTDSPKNSNYKLILKEQKTGLSLNPRERSRLTLLKPAASPDRSDPRQSAPAGILPLQGVITSTTGLRNDPFNGQLKHHNGLDIAAPSGTPVKPVAPGTVIFSGWRGGYGNTVIIEHEDGMLSVYAHHASNQVPEGVAVDRSTVIALSGSTGRSTGPHLHFEAWKNGDNVTPSFLPSGTPVSQRQIIASAPVKRILQPDGTILFTNLR